MTRGTRTPSRGDSQPPIFFATAAVFRAWLERHHAHASELSVGFWKRGSGRPSISWPEAVDAALCFGWIDGVRNSIDETAYRIRFTPRNARSIWSAINIARMADLNRQGLVRASGRAAFDHRDERRSAVYSHEREKPARFTAAQTRRLRASARAWDFFRAQPPWYRRAATHWVTTAVKEETRERRFTTLIADSAAGRTVRPLTRPGPRKR
jgi:uncharacterized protein YdeI (YjbR/CyaY-like superfamily)